MSDTFDTLTQRLGDVLRQRAALHAVYGNYGTFDHTRKILLSATRNTFRDTFASTGEKATEARLDDLAHADGEYQAFIATATEQRTQLALLDAEMTLLEHRLSHLKAQQYHDAQLARLT